MQSTIQHVHVKMDKITEFVEVLRQYAWLFTHEDDISNLYFGDLDKISVSHRSGRGFVDTADATLLLIIQKYTREHVVPVKNNGTVH